MPVFEGQCTREVLWSSISVEVRGGDPCSSKDTSVIDVLETMEMPENGCVRIKTSPCPKGIRINN